ncbi:phage tail tape measure protein [Tissierella sp. MB52-C2]|uniref:phage tail tape measure protein n=1 Tax=Tissierella sp. MB52-C2 TaxID=3070999 RepID=UPI00280C0E81|nr:phage tail tape measure protein [Tissierella sp. MB52-C2]WMM26658.1 phage tail tape measure protein [Tissierella sp. MB52-C2]
MAKEREVNVIVDAKNKSKGAFVEIRQDLKQLGDEANKGVSKFTSSFANADKVVLSFADRMKWMDKVAKRTFQGTAAAAAVYVGATLRDFTQLNDGISKVNTLYDQTSDSQRKMYQDSIKMFSLLPTDFNKITQGIYDTISAGADPKYATMFSRKFGMAGVAGDSDMDIVTKAAMGTMNAYKLEAKDLNKILDLQFMTVKDGITSYSELASSLGTGVLANAKTAGITLEELYGSIAMITKNAIPANIATTSLNQMFNKFTDTKVIKRMGQFGVKIQDANKNTRPLIEILKDLNYQFDKRNMTSEQRKGFFKDLLGSDEAARAILPLISDLKEFQKILGDMDNSSGAMKDAFNDRLESMQTQFKLFWNQIKGVGLEHIMTLDPLLNAIMEPWIKKVKLGLEIEDLKDTLQSTENPHTKQLTMLEIESLENQLSSLDFTPVDKFRDSLAESVKELEKINPPLAKFLETIGNFTLSFVGKDGVENREKVGNLAKGVVKVYGIKKFIDAMNWFNKNFKPIKDNKESDVAEALVKTLQTMNVNANMVNIYGKNINSVGKGEVPTVAGTPPKPNAPNSEAIPLPGEVAYIGYATSLTTGIYVPEEYKVGGKKYDELENKLLNAIEDKKTNKDNSNNFNPSRNNMNLYSLRDGSSLKPKSVDNKISKEQVESSINLMKTNVMDELLKLKDLDNKINMQNRISVEAPKVETKIYIDGKNIPVQRVEVDYKKVEKQSEVQARRYGRIDMPY